MSATPVTLILLAAGTLGVIMFLKFLRGERNGGGMIATHLILGAAALEQIALLFRGAPNGEAWPSEPMLKTGAAFLAFAMMSGFAAPLLRSSNGTKMLYIHVGLGAAGALLVLAWVLRA
jgi:hypothetical protein